MTIKFTLKKEIVVHNEVLVMRRAAEAGVETGRESDWRPSSLEEAIEELMLVEDVKYPRANTHGYEMVLDTMIRSQ